MTLKDQISQSLTVIVKDLIFKPSRSFKGQVLIFKWERVPNRNPLAISGIKNVGSHLKKMHRLETTLTNMVKVKSKTATK